jgi:hypothetical protein
MMNMLSGSGRCVVVLIMAVPAWSAALMPPAQQTELVHHYCAVCHTDAAKNGGLSLEHYDAAAANPPLAAMLLSKLRNGAMGAAGLGVPDKPTQEAWVAATTAQAEGARNWTVMRTDGRLTASIVRDVDPRRSGTPAPVYRLTLACDTASHQGEIQMTWSPDPQTNRTFTVSADGAAISQRVEGEEHMGNGQAGASGRASAKLNAPLAEKTLTVSDLFVGEQVDFPVGDLDGVTRRQLADCLSAARGTVK